MTLVDLMEITIDSHESLPCEDFDCDLCIELGHEQFDFLDKVELRLTDDKNHAILVFGRK